MTAGNLKKELASGAGGPASLAFYDVSPAESLY
jgi:hypothetical protein